MWSVRFMYVWAKTFYPCICWFGDSRRGTPACLLEQMTMAKEPSRRRGYLGNKVFVEARGA